MALSEMSVEEYKQLLKSWNRIGDPNNIPQLKSTFTNNKIVKDKYNYEICRFHLIPQNLASGKNDIIKMIFDVQDSAFSKEVMINIGKDLRKFKFGACQKTFTEKMQPTKNKEDGAVMFFQVKNPENGSKYYLESEDKQFIVEIDTTGIVDKKSWRYNYKKYEGNVATGYKYNGRKCLPIYKNKNGHVEFLESLPLIFLCAEKKELTIQCKVFSKDFYYLTDQDKISYGELVLKLNTCSLTSIQSSCIDNIMTEFQLQNSNELHEPVRTISQTCNSLNVDILKPAALVAATVTDPTIPLTIPEYVCTGYEFASFGEGLGSNCFHYLDGNSFIEGDSGMDSNENNDLQVPGIWTPEDLPDANDILPPMKKRRIY